MAIGGSTNAIIHLKAIAGRLGIDLPLTRFDEISRETPVILNVSPSGKYLMEDVFYAGGLPAVMREMIDALTWRRHHRDRQDNGRERRRCRSSQPRRSSCRRTKPLQASGGTVILGGNLCPNGAVIKTSAADPKLLQHTGRAVVFEDHADFMNRLEDPDLEIDENSVMVLKNGGPKGAPGMPEVGNLSIPSKLLKRGVKDILRISDARMSGTSYGAVVLHIAPEAAIGGPLAAVENGDEIRLDVENRRLDVLVDEHEMNRRLRSLPHRDPAYDRGYGRLFLDNVLQADEGCDFGFLKGKGGGRWATLPF